MRSGFLYIVALILAVSSPAVAATVPADWAVQDESEVLPFLDLLNVKENYQRERNLSGYLDMLPGFLAAQLKNQAATLGWDEVEMADSFQKYALSEAILEKLEVIGFKQKG